MMMMSCCTLLAVLRAVCFVRFGAEQPLNESCDATAPMLPFRCCLVLANRWLLTRPVGQIMRIDPEGNDPNN